MKKILLIILLVQLPGFVFAQNLALNKPATQSSTHNGATASRAVDGNTSGIFSDLSTTHTDDSGSENPWWRVDLESAYTIGSVKIFNRSDNHVDRLIGAKVMVGNTDSTNPNDFIEIGILTSAYEQEINNQNVQARYVLVYLPGSRERLSLAEVEVYGSSTTSTAVSAVEVSPVNLSVQVGESSTLSATILPSNASNQNIDWSSSNTAIATVGSDGAVTALSVGTATITATTQDGSFTDSSILTVTNSSSGSGGNSGSNSVWSETGSVASYTGNVAVGRSTVPSGYKMAVEGKIRTREVRVDQDNWPDYVFKDDYDLPSLEEIQKYIGENGHLPNIPSAQEVMANGVELGEMDKLLLEKIEELTLYLLQLEKKYNTVQSKLLKQQKEISTLKAHQK